MNGRILMDCIIVIEILNMEIIKTPEVVYA